MKRLQKMPVTLSDANAFVRQFHRHHKPVQGHKFSIGATVDGRLVGVVIVGRPVNRVRDDGRTLEVTRCCTDGTPNACSGAARQATFALGYHRLGTYIRVDESGISLKAAGWRWVARVTGRTWNCISRPRKDRTDIVDRDLFEATA